MTAISKDRLIAHRFRGFAAQENTIEGLLAAMDAGALYLECDIRITADAVPVVYHDQDAAMSDGAMADIAFLKLLDFESLGGTFAAIPTLQDLLAAFAAHPNKKARLLLDIKTGGAEAMISALVRLHRLETRVTYVSWVSEALYNMHDIEPDAPLIFSHWASAAPPDDKHEVYYSADGLIRRGVMGNLHAGRHAWAVARPLKGQMLDMLKRTGGGICVPKAMMTRTLADHYHQHGLITSTFSYTDPKEIQGDLERYETDLFFADSRELFA